MTSWRKSSFSDTTNCVEVRDEGDDVWVRNSHNIVQPPTRFTRGEWDAFLKGVRAGEFG